MGSGHGCNNNKSQCYFIFKEATTHWTAEFFDNVVDFCSYARDSVDALGGLVTPIAFLVTGMVLEK